MEPKQRAQQIFGQHAANYVTSSSHAKGSSLGRLIELVQPQAGQRALDIATGGGHTALGLAQAGATVWATDLTHRMLTTARAHISQKTDHIVHYARHDAEEIPFASNTFDRVTCRIAPHHFPDVEKFVLECARVLKPGGVLGVVDIISPVQAKAAQYCNNFERLRDPSHVWAYALPDWEYFLSNAGLTHTHTETYGLQMYLGVWAQRLGCTDATIHRLRAMLLQAPAAIREWYQLKAEPPHWSMLADIEFYIQQAIIIGHLMPSK